MARGVRGSAISGVIWYLLVFFELVGLGNVQICPPFHRYQIKQSQHPAVLICLLVDWRSYVSVDTLKSIKPSSKTVKNIAFIPNLSIRSNIYYEQQKAR